MKIQKNYFGLDIGTNTVGYTVTDSNYHVQKVAGKRAIGVVKFDEPNTAAERRVFRTTRRRLQRRRYRVVLLDELFQDELAKKDANFLPRLAESDLKHFDKTQGINQKFMLFNDSNFNDANYYSKYPTIYHLRNELMENAENTDIRLLYLALHHIIKNRGNFLTEGSFEECQNIKAPFEQLNKLLEDRISEIYQENDGIVDKETNVISPFDLTHLKKLESIIIDKKLPRVEKKKQINEILNASTSNQKNLINAFMGDKVNIVKMFGEGEYEKDSVSKFYFSDDFDKVEGELNSTLTQKDFEIIVVLKAIYDWQILTKTLDGDESLSLAMIKKYEKHKSDLAKLKTFIKEYIPNEYENMFGLPIKINDKGKKAIDDKKANYCYYIGGGKIDGKKIEGNGRLGKTCNENEFYKFVKDILNKVNVEIQPEDATIKEEIFKDMDNYDFMPKIISKNNSTLPYQLNMIELEKILNNAKVRKEFSFLNVVSDGYSVADKIKMLLKFRIDYFVGPVKSYKDEKFRSKNSWAVREEGRITPWSYDKLICKNESNIKFIERMSSNCTYLGKAGAKALPKNSILFSKFNALNELNKLKINENPIEIQLKQEIFDEVYLKQKASVKNIVKFLKLKGKDDVKITGIDGELKGNMESYRMLKSIIGSKVDKYPSMAERLIFLMTIYSGGNALADAISHEFGGDKGLLTLDEIKRLKGLKYNGWSGLSKELLSGSAVKHGIRLVDEQGQVRDIIEILYDTNENFMQIIFNEKYNFNDEINKYFKDCGVVESNEVSYEDVKNMYCSPSVKKSVWQSFEIVRELVKETDAIPEKVFIEVTRENNDNKKGKRTTSRHDQIKYAYIEAMKLSKDWQRDSLESFSKILDETVDSKLNSDMIYLYFMQLGKCAYSNEKIELDELKNCDIEHIIPQSKKKDDSLDNIILVKKTLNGNKTDIYPVPSKYQSDAKILWDSLRKMKLMSDIKYQRLTRTTELTQAEEYDFIQRQLVETSQSALLVKELLTKWFKGKAENDVEIILSKAGNVSNFRKNFYLTKSRDVNDFHHAYDAYLNIVVGNVLHEKYSHNIKHVDRDENINKSAKFEKAFESDVYSYREKRKIWEGYKSENPTINLVKKEMSVYGFSVGYSTRIGKGELYKATLFKASGKNDIDDKDDCLYPICESKIVDGKEMHPKSNTALYGGYKTSGTAYFVVVDSVAKKSKIQRSIEAVPIYYDKKIANGKMTMQDFLQNVLKLQNPKLAEIDQLKKSIIKVGALIEYDGVRLRLAGTTDNRITFHNANQLYVSKEINDYVKELSIFKKKINNATVAIKDKEEKELAQLKLCNELIGENERRAKLPNQHSKIVLIKVEENCKLYDYFIEKISNNTYSKIPTYDCLYDILVKGKDSFLAMNICEQLELLLNIIVAFQCNALCVDASKLSWMKIDKNGNETIKYGGENQCKIVKNKCIDDWNIALISQSKTGLREKPIKLNR